MPRCRHCKTKFEPKAFNQKWCMGSDECVNAFLSHAREVKTKSDAKAWKQKKNALKPTIYVRENKTKLQSEINKLARLIDKKFGFGCIDCDRGFQKQTDAAHFHNVSGHENIRFNLHNIHSARSECNKFDPNHKMGYAEGLIKRHGQDYFNFVNETIGLEYKSIKLSAVEVVEKIALVRKIIRDFDTYVLDGPIQSRRIFNKLIGIYKD